MAVTFTSKKEIVARLKAQIARNENTAIHALLFIYALQDSSEQESAVTALHNGVGFTKRDAAFCTGLVNQYNESGSFSFKQIECIKRVMPKYAGQIVSSKLHTGDIIKVGKVYTWVA